ncbi:hypothetical protein DXG03_009470 [Asterophora parasitica]|uniref:Nudix hydrolase domain-containing protein n=1 Tax=Asterophora parasitica TaxID=117018 RepID=A0A9P7G4V2_9AGAR|nr:hypothetical protein DXG03_009470 [Asterophora parasitica]
MSMTPKLTSSTELPTSEAKWITLRKLTYQDAKGKEVESSFHQVFPDSAELLTSVYGSALNARRVNQRALTSTCDLTELPAGLVDEGETPEQAAFRELQEETGYKAHKVIESSPVVVSDPGMTNANMKLIVLDVELPDKMEYPEQKLEAGEFITTHVVELAKLDTELKGRVLSSFRCHLVIQQSLIRQNMQARHVNQVVTSEYLPMILLQGFFVDARLSHFASGYALARSLK